MQALDFANNAKCERDWVINFENFHTKRETFYLLASFKASLDWKNQFLLFIAKEATIFFNECHCVFDFDIELQIVLANQNGKFKKNVFLEICLFDRFLLMNHRFFVKSNFVVFFFLYKFSCTRKSEAGNLKTEVFLLLLFIEI